MVRIAALGALLPEAVVKEMALFGRVLGADRCATLGFAAGVSDDPCATALDIADRLRATSPRVSGVDVTSSIGTNVKYAAVHEYGCAPYTIRARNGKALRWGNATGVHFARTVRHPGFPARRMFETGIEDRADAYGEALSATILSEATK